MDPSMKTYMSTPPAAPPAAAARSFLPEGLKTGLILALVAGGAYLVYDGYQFQHKTASDLTVISDKLKALENHTKAGEATMSSLKGEINQTQQASRQELRKTAAQIEAESHKTKTELSKALATKADSSQVQALKQDADTKIGQVSSEVGGVKTEVGTVKTDLATTRKDLEGTQRQLIDVKDTLSAAVAKNATELADLRRKGERDYFEFEIKKKNLPTKVEDIRLALTGTDAKKGKYSMQVLVDDSKLEKRDRTVNEPVQFLVGRNRLRYEVVVNWVQKDRVGGYLSTPKDKALSAEKAAAAK